MKSSRLESVQQPLNRQKHGLKMSDEAYTEVLK